MTNKSIRIGTDDFAKLRGDNGYFVDKSLLIREVIDGSDVLLLPRPRRFGKTLNLSMLRYFFERVEDEEEQERRRALFDGLRITQDAEAMQHFGRYPTIFLTLKDVKGESWDTAYQKLLSRIADLCSDVGRNPENIWSFLYFAGYLKAEDPRRDPRGRLRYRLSIPNREVE